MKQIPLTQGQFALVDDEDFERINAHKWSAHWSPSAKAWFAIRSSPRNPPHKRHIIYMHREVMRAQPNQLVDHKYHRTLDNRKSELRLCSVSQNGANQRISTRNASGYKGVSWVKRDRRWTACVRFNGRSLHLGVFPSARSAAMAYDAKAIEVFGKFALTNEALGLL